MKAPQLGRRCGGVSSAVIEAARPGQAARRRSLSCLAAAWTLTSTPNTNIIAKPSSRLPTITIHAALLNPVPPPDSIHSEAARAAQLPPCSETTTTTIPSHCTPPPSLQRVPQLPRCFSTLTQHSSPQGRIFQIEYAAEAVKQGSVVVGIASKTHAVLCAIKVRPLASL